MNETYLTVADFNSLIITFFGVLLCIFLMILVVYLIIAVRRVCKILKGNESNIKKLLETLPTAVEDVNKAVKTMNGVVDVVTNKSANVWTFLIEFLKSVVDSFKKSKDAKIDGASDTKEEE